MSSEPLYFADPRVKQDAADAGLLGGANPVRYLPEAKNFADDDTVRQQVIVDVQPVIDQCRNDRRNLENEWAAIRRMETLTHDEGRRYLGRSSAYLPVWQKNLNSLTTNISRGLFPSDDYMDVYSPNPDLAKQAGAIKQYLQYEFEAMARLRVNLKPAIRNLVSFGTAPVKHIYVKQTRNVGFARKPTLSSMAGVLEHSYKPESYCEGLRISARDLFNWYVYPATASTLDEAQMIFETINISRDFLEKMMLSGNWAKEPCQHLLAAGPNTDPEHNLAEQDKLDNFAARAPVPGKTEQNFGSIYTITEVWCFFRLPDGAYLDTDVKGAPLPCKITLCDQYVLEVRRNPHYHQRAPYDVARMNVQSEFFYGSGFGRVVRNPQYLANDFANQTNDCGIYALNPQLKVNPGLLTAPLTPFKPGGVWYMTDPAAVTWDRPPIEQTGFGLQMMSTYIGMAQDFGGAPPILQGVGAGRAGKTATQAQILQKNASLPLQDIVEDVEVDLMVPLMRAAWMNGIQYREKPVMAVIAGQPIEIRPEMLALPDAEMRWLASSQAVNQQMRSQQAMQFLQVLLPTIPLLQQMGKQVDVTPLLRRIYTEGLGFRDFDTVVRDLTPEEQIAMAQQQMGGMMGPGGPEQEPIGEGGDRVRSPVEQAEGSPEQYAEPAPDSGDFMAVRGEADDMAAMMGAAGGGEIE